MAVLVKLMLSGVELNVEQVDVDMFVSDEPGEQMLGELGSGKVVVFLLTEQVEQLLHELVRKGGVPFSDIFYMSTNE